LAAYKALSQKWIPLLLPVSSPILHQRLAFPGPETYFAILKKITTMTIQEIAARFDELAQTGQWGQIVDELFSEDAESIEPASGGAGMPSVKGKEAMRKKGEEFNAQMEEFHSAYCSPAVMGGNHFSVAMGMDVTMKGAGRIKMDEICVYKVEDGKIVKEQFFY
jgi:hypothetical protein